MSKIRVENIEMTTTPKDALIETTKMLDRMTLYEILIKYIEPGENDYRYRWSNGFLDCIDIIGEIMRKQPEVAEDYRELSGLEFIEFVLIPKFLSISKVRMMKSAVLPEYGKNVDTVKITWDEVNAEDEKTFDPEKMSETEFYELAYMSKLVYTKILIDLRDGRMSLPNIIIKQIKNKMESKK